MLTFEQFLATKKLSANLAADIPHNCWDEAAGTPEGYTYMGSLYIERVLPHWPEAARKRGGWYLIIGNCEYITPTIEPLERKLFEFALSEGYTIEELPR